VGPLRISYPRRQRRRRGWSAVDMPTKPAVAGGLQTQSQVSRLAERSVAARAEWFNDALNLARDAPDGQRPTVRCGPGAENATHVTPVSASACTFVRCGCRSKAPRLLSACLARIRPATAVKLCADERSGTVLREAANAARPPHLQTVRVAVVSALAETTRHLS
jgi:hypothetical protein